MRHAALALMMPVIILGGIYGGVFTPTEASAVSVMYALTVGIFLYREINYANFMKALQRSVVSTSIIMFIIACAGLFSFLITRDGIPASIGMYLTEILQSPLEFLLGVTVALFIIGMFIESSEEQTSELQ